MIFVDTSHLLALAMPVDALHKLATAWSDALPGPFLTTANISEALTYDQHFEQAGFRALLRYSPSS